MTNPQPVEVKNLDGYGHPPLDWSAVLERLERASGLDQPTYLGTVSPGGRSHATPIGPMWHEGQMYFTSGPGALKARNIAKNPSCSIAGRVEGMDLVLEGTASMVTDSRYAWRDDEWMRARTGHDWLRNGDFDVNQPPKKTVTSVLRKAGTVEYYCRFHPNMKGRIKIAP